MSARIWTRSFASRLESGSSIRKTLGSRTIARPIATRWRWPPESWPGLRCEVLGQAEQLGDLAHAALALRLLHLRDPQREGDVRRDGEVGVERVVLEHHRDVAALRRHVGDVAAADQDRAGVDLLEAGEHAQRRRLARAGRADEHHELAVGDVEVERVDGGRVRARVDARRLLEAHVSHRSPPVRRRGGELLAHAVVRRGVARRAGRARSSAAPTTGGDAVGRSSTFGATARSSCEDQRRARGRPCS